MEINGIKIDYLGHSGFLFSFGNKRVIVDPFEVHAMEKADLVLITHSHYDHCSIKDIRKVVKPGSMIIVPADAQSKIAKVQDINMQVMEPGDEIVFGKIKIRAIPAYNIGKDSHPKKNGWMGYVILYGTTVIYHAGDTDRITEMQNLAGYGKVGNTFICLLPVSGKYVMDYYEAAEAAAGLNVALAIPMHYGSIVGTLEDAKSFVQECEKKGVKAVVLEKK
ncbi:MAG: MBL fold metallo-hydrolase [archaeon]